MLVLCTAVFVAVLVVSGSWTVYSLYVGARDAHDLSTKLSTPHPVSVCDWPELRVDSIVVDPTRSCSSPDGRLIPDDSPSSCSKSTNPRLAASSDGVTAPL